MATAPKSIAKCIGQQPHQHTNNSEYERLKGFFKKCGVEEHHLSFGEHQLKLAFAEDPVAGVGVDSDLTGLCLWPGAEVLCRWLYHNKATVRMSSFIELGAGCGVVGLFAHRLGAKRVMITDGSEMAIACIAHNIYLQETCSASKASYAQVDESRAATGILECNKLLWSAEGVAELAKPLFCQREDELSASSAQINFDSFDYILGAEVAYSEDTVTFLLSTVKHLLLLHYGAFHKQQQDSLSIGHKQELSGADYKKATFLLTHTKRFSNVDGTLFAVAAAEGFDVKLMDLPPVPSPSSAATYTLAKASSQNGHSFTGNSFHWSWWRHKHLASSEEQSVDTQSESMTSDDSTSSWVQIYAFQLRDEALHLIHDPF